MTSVSHWMQKLFGQHKSPRPLFRGNGTVARGEYSSFPHGYATQKERADVFDPALKHYPRAFVKGPATKGAHVDTASARARSNALRVSLGAIATSQVRDQVIVRGSTALEVWFGNRARRARDLDLVVREASIGPHTPVAREILASLCQCTCDALEAAAFHVLEHRVALDAIWTYERAEGRRLSIPFVADGVLHETVQIDVVFQETLVRPPSLESIGFGDGPAPNSAYRSSALDAAPRVWFVSRAESLVWKLLWLESDMHPQGKDLYDAVLLAESRTAAFDSQFARSVYEAKEMKWTDDIERFARIEQIDWANFATEYPDLVTGSADDYGTRLVRAATPNPLADPSE